MLGGMSEDLERALATAKLQLRLRDALATATSRPERRAAVAEVVNEERLRPKRRTD